MQLNRGSQEFLQFFTTRHDLDLNIEPWARVRWYLFLLQWF